MEEMEEKLELLQSQLKQLNSPSVSSSAPFFRLPRYLGIYT